MLEKFLYVKCIIDSIKIIVAVLNSFYLHKMINSNHKSDITMKLSVQIGPSGGFFFVSSVYPRRIFDWDITVESRILNLDLWNPGEEQMYDEGFKIFQE